MYCIKLWNSCACTAVYCTLTLFFYFYSRICLLVRIVVKAVVNADAVKVVRWRFWGLAWRCRWSSWRYGWSWTPSRTNSPSIISSEIDYIDPVAHLFFAILASIHQAKWQWSRVALAIFIPVFTYNWSNLQLWISLSTGLNACKARFTCCESL